MRGERYKRCVSVVLFLAALVLLCPGDVITYIRFEENGGTTASDQTGLLDGELIQFDSTLPGAGDLGDEGWSVSVPLSIIPLTGDSNSSSIRMSGGSEFIDLSNGLDLSLGTDFTIEFFMKPDSVSVASVCFGLSPVSGLSMMISDNLGDLYFNMSFMGETPYVPATGVQTGVWQHVALVKEPGEYSLYLDGSLLTNATLSSSADGPYFFPGTDVTGDRTVGGNSGTWRGYLDEFRISDEALTPDQFLNHQVPEPSTTILLLIGGCLLLTDRRQRGASSD